METDFPLYLIPLLPLAGAAINLLVGKRISRGGVAAIACTSVAMAAVLGWKAAWLLFQSEPSAILTARFFDGDWIHATESHGIGSLHIQAGLLLDRLSAVMVLVITTVGFLIHLYSTAYMEEDKNFNRYFGYLNLFTGAMLILVLGDSLPVTFVGWEGVGLCSYLLIGFWFDKEANAYAGRKAFIVNRVGDFGFLLGMFLIFSATSTLSYRDLASQQSVVALHHVWFAKASIATVAGLLLFVGATGKSAQLPLYVWLPDAMAGPTPVSALTHAATMVTAGVYMIARLHFLFEIDPFVLAVIASVGALTALFAATIGITQKPIKKILAYSTVSQLGFMFIGVGTKAYDAGVFHLVTHAFFKAGLFLGAGSIMHALSGEEDVTKMGGLRAKMPITRWTFLVYCLAIAGIFPFAGFFSKDAILAGAWSFDVAEMPEWPHWLGHAIYFVGLSAAFMTAFYMFRAYFLVFHGEFRGDHHTWDHAHESPPAMTLPLVVLAIGSAALGFLGMPEAFHKDWNLFEQWLVPANFAPMVGEEHASTEWALMAVATVVAGAGIFLAYRLYYRGISPTAVAIKDALPRLYKVVFNKYWVDEIYDSSVVRPLRSLAFVLWKGVDALFIDLILVRGSAFVVDLVGRGVRYLQSGDVQRYMAAVLLGTAAIIAVSANWVACTGAPFDVEQHGADVTVRAHGMPSGPAARPLEFSFDFGDGTPPVKQSTPTVRHHYDVHGRRRLTVNVLDPRWDIRSSDSRTVVIP